MEKKRENKLGYEFTPYSFVIERGKIREFAHAIGDSNPIYHDVEEARKAGYPDLAVPPTFATVIDMWAGPSFDDLIQTLELDGLKVLHGKQHYEYIKDFYPGDVISCRQKVVEVSTKRKMNFIVLETVYTNQYDEVVLKATSTLIEQMEKR